MPPADPTPRMPTALGQTPTDGANPGSGDGPDRRDAEVLLCGLRLAGRRVVILGDGPGCVRRVRELGRTGAVLHIVCDDPAAADAIAALGHAVERRGWRPGDLAGAHLAAICLDAGRDAPLAEARAEHALVYVPDVPEECDLILAAIVQAGPLRLAVSTGGASPAAARRGAERVGAALPWTAAATVSAMATVRRHLKADATSLPPYGRWADAFDAGWDAADPMSAWSEVGRALDQELSLPCSLAGLTGDSNVHDGNDAARLPLPPQADPLGE